MITFYITYEELKQAMTAKQETAKQLFILPMRNWNAPKRERLEKYYSTFYITYEELKRWIGRYFNYIFDIIFLYYLWGIETAMQSIKRNLINSFYITYEELKLKTDTPLRIVLPLFILPMRNWNGRVYRSR